MHQAIFFDRDDTLIKDVPYNGDPALVELLPGAAETCQALRAAGFLLFIVSNQSGVGRGMITQAQVEAVNRRVAELLGENVITKIYCCYDTPENPTDCRKPSPKMLLDAARDYSIDLRHSWMVGDKVSDILAGKNAGCRTVYVNERKNQVDLFKAKEMADFVVDRIEHVGAIILAAAKNLGS